VRLKSFISLLVLFFVVGFFLQFILYENKSIETKIEEQLTNKDRTFQQLVHYDIKNNYIYVFYLSNRYNTASGLGLGKIENNRSMKTSLIGGILADSKLGFSYGTAESKQLGDYIVYGIITNHEIAAVEFNEQECEIVTEGEIKLWYFISGNSPSSSLIKAKDRTGRVLIEKRLF